MKYAEMQSAIARDKPGKRPTGKHGRSNPTQNALRSRAEPAETLPLLSGVEAEEWLGERLKHHGYDIYAGGTYATYADRLRACIVRNRCECVIVGRNADGRPENYRDCWERLYGRKLTDVPRVSRNTQD